MVLDELGAPPKWCQTPLRRPNLIRALLATIDGSLQAEIYSERVVN
jgi:hypothetical protein